MIGSATIRPHRVALCLLVLALSGCDAAELVGSPLACRRDDECRDSLRCEYNFCTVPRANSLVLQARITPRADLGLVAQQVPRIDLSSGAAVSVTLLSPATFRGVVRPADDPFTVNVPGELEFRADGDIPGVDYRFTARSLDGLDALGDGFSTLLVPGRAYRGVFRPDGATWPRVFFTVTADTIAAGRLELQLPAATAIARVTGRVRFADYVPVRGARVVVLSPAGDVLGATTTDEERGRFELPVDQVFRSVDIRVEPPAGGVLFPEFRVDGLEVGTELDLVAPSAPAGTTTVSAGIAVVEANAEGGEPRPIAGVPVTIVGVLAGGTLRLSTTTGADGIARFETFPGAYECLISVPPELAVASWHGYITLAPTTDRTAEVLRMVQLQPRSRVRAQFVDFEGIPIIGGTASFERLPSRGPDDTLVIAPEPFITAIEPDGSVELLVDPGTYTVRVTPDIESGAPLHRIDGFEVPTDGVETIWALPAPALLHLTVAGPDGAWLPDAGVELWLPGDDGNPRLLGRGQTNANGFWDVQVPHIDAR
jgi:hypothetical protein